MSLDSTSFSIANIKNRAELTQLNVELKKLEREKQDALRSYNNEKQRLRARYVQDSSVIEASDVKMFETHTPGFCYRRNGEQKFQQMPVINSNVDFEHLHFLLFTDGEIDIEKLLCLHLLSTYETEHLTPPIKPKTVSTIIYKKISPLEQLVERSKKKHSELMNSLLLPTYVLDINVDDQENRHPRDSRLSSRLLINEKILELITTVVTTLKASNPEKVQQLMELAQDPLLLKRIFCKPHIKEFISKLKHHQVVCRSHSYSEILLPSLVRFLFQILRSVIYIKHEQIKEAQARAMRRPDIILGALLEHSINSTFSCCSFALTQPLRLKPNHLEVRTVNGYLENFVRYIRQNVLQLPTHATWRKSEATSESPRLNKAEEEHQMEESTNRFRRTPKNFVTKNIAAAGKVINKIGKLEMKRRNSVVEKKEPRDNKRLETKSDNTGKGQNRKCSDVKHHLKRSTCPACMEKWRTPLPSPKISTVKKLENTENCIIKCNSIQRLSTMIERELYKLNTYDRKYSNASTISSLSTAGKKKPVVNKDYLDLVTLDLYDLERIKLEIREKEVSKKLEKFLGTF